MIAFILGICIPIFCGIAIPQFVWFLLVANQSQELSDDQYIALTILSGLGSLIVYLVWLVHAGYVKLV